MRCPICRLENPDDAMRCDCGYDFDTGNIEQSYFKEISEFKQPSDGLKLWGWIFSFLGGLIGILIAYSIAYGKDKNTRQYIYDEKSRKMGESMLLVSAFVTAFVIFVRLIIAFRK